MHTYTHVFMQGYVYLTLAPPWGSPHFPSTTAHPMACPKRTARPYRGGATHPTLASQRASSEASSALRPRCSGMDIYPLVTFLGNFGVAWYLSCSGMCISIRLLLFRGCWCSLVHVLLGYGYLSVCYLFRKWCSLVRVLLGYGYLSVSSLFREFWWSLVHVSLG